MPGLRGGDFDEILTPDVVPDPITGTVTSPEVRDTDPIQPLVAVPLPDLSDPVPAAQAETQRLEIADETLLHLRARLQQVLAEPPPVRRRPPVDLARTTTRSSLAGLVAVIVVALVVSLGLVAWQLVS